MYCQNCGAVLKDGVNFCPECGSPINAPAPVEPAPAPAAPVQRQPENPPYQPVHASAPVYAQPAAPVYHPSTASVPKKRRALILPGIIAILSTAYAVIGWISVLTTMIPLMIENYGYDAYYGYAIFYHAFSPMLELAAGIFLFLFCLVQYRKGRSSMFGIFCLLEVAYYGSGFLSYPLAAILYDGFSLKVLDIVFLLLYLGIITLLVIGMIGAFKGRLNKIVLIIAAVLMICMRIISTLYNCIVDNYVDFDAILLQIVYFLLNTLLPIALLLTAILWKPAKAE